MKNKQSGNLTVSLPLALLAGALGSALTLIATGNLTVPFFNASQPQELIQPNVSAQTNPADVNPDGATDRKVELAVSQLDETAEPPLAKVSEALEQASAERAQLAQVMAQLTVQIETLEADLINLQALDTLNLADVEQTQAHSTSEFDDAMGFGRPRSPQARIEDLMASGVDEDQAQALQSRQDQYQLARLELIDLAEREGWADSEEFSSRLEALDEQRPDLRSELGDEAYDRYLFEAGRNNRVVFESIIPGSAAQSAGLQAGDLVLVYADQRIFSTADLQRATRSGVLGETVVLSIERQEQTLFFEIPRGPLGVSLRAQQRRPS